MRGNWLRAGAISTAAVVMGAGCSMTRLRTRAAEVRAANAFEKQVVDEVLVLDLDLVVGGMVRVNADLLHALRIDSLVICSSGKPVSMFLESRLNSEPAAVFRFAVGHVVGIHVRYPLAIPSPTRLPDCIQGQISLVSVEGVLIGSSEFEARSSRSHDTETANQ